MDGHGRPWGDHTDNYGQLWSDSETSFHNFSRLRTGRCKDRRSLHITHSDQRLARLGLPVLG